ncbi:hypothetical protein AAC387_Pa02g0619 [Persea americana]
MPLSLLPLATLLLSFLCFYFLLRFIYSLFWAPWKLQLHFQRQGLRGPPRHPIFGNSGEIRDLIARAQSEPLAAGFGHEIMERVMPHYYHWSRRYGKTFVYWFGLKPRIALADPDLIKEVLVNASGCFEKVGFNPLSGQLFGQGLVGLKGDKWARHRRIANSAFNMERVKGWVPEITASTRNMLEKWERNGLDGHEFEIEVHKELHNLTADIISRTAFGSNYEEGKLVFQLQEEQMLLVSQAIRSVYIPGFRFIPTKKNRRRWILEKKIRESLRKLIEINGEVSQSSKNLLGLMTFTNRNQEEGERIGIEEIIDECKTFYFAGKETSANLMTWVLLLLGLHQEWQTRARGEVVRVCGSHSSPTIESLTLLKLIGMIIDESLRLYPPAVMLMRQSCKDVKLGAMVIPANTQLYLPMTAIHHDTKLWGEDAEKFNPFRFSETRKHFAAFFPFGLGPRICVGQNLATVEVKIVLAMILQRFSFIFSPSYVHAPMQLLTLQPQYGAQILFHKI